MTKETMKEFDEITKKLRDDVIAGNTREAYNEVHKLLLNRRGTIYFENKFVNLIIKNLLTKLRLPFGTTEAAKILDCGSGDGKLCNYLKNEGVDVVSIDISEVAIKQQKELKLEKIVQGDVTCLPFKRDTFDCGLSKDVIEHLPDPGRYIYEIKRVLKKNGIIIILTPNKRIISILRHLRTRNTKDWLHIHEYEKEELEEFIQHCGFEIISNKVNVSSLVKYAIKDLRLAKSLFLNLLFNSTIIIVAKKI